MVHHTSDYLMVRIWGLIYTLINYGVLQNCLLSPILPSNIHLRQWRTTTTVAFYLTQPSCITPGTSSMAMPTSWRSTLTMVILLPTTVKSRHRPTKPQRITKKHATMSSPKFQRLRTSSSTSKNLKPLLWRIAHWQR